MIQRGFSLMASNLSALRKQHDDENKWHGDTVISPKEPHCLRMVFHNVRGLSLRGVDGLEMFIHEQAALQIDIQAFSEHCLDTTKYHVPQTAKEILRKTYPGQSLIQLTSSQEPAVNQYKPGGTGLLLLGQAASRLEPNGRGGDVMGRWGYVHLRRKNLPPVTVISVYQVCPRPTNLIGNTAYHQQQRALNIANRALSPRQAFIQDLDHFLTVLRNQGNDIILGGDFNESLEDKHSGILSLITTHQLSDPFLYRFPHHTNFGTHVSGKRRIDYVFVTESILHSVRAIGYGPFDYISSSDHRPLFLELDSNLVFGRTFINLQQPGTRGVKTSDPTMVRRFVETTYQHLQRSQAFAYQTALDDDSAEPEIVEFVDSLIGRSEEVAEQKCQRRRPEFYSRTIVKQRIEVAILKGHLNALKLNRDRSQQLRQKMQRTGVIVPLPPTQRLTQQALTSACTKLHDTCRNSFHTRQAELASKILEAQQDGDQAKSKVLKAMKKVEESRSLYRIMKALRRPQGASQQLDRIEIPASWPSMSQEIASLDHLEDPKTCKEWRFVSEPSEVEYYLMLRNRLHFGQAEGTPFTIHPLSEDVDWAATTAASEQILQGKYLVSTTTAQLNELVAACKACNPLDSISHEITLGEFKGKMKAWRESTTTSPSGRHLGRYKALFTAIPTSSDDSEEADTPFLQKQEAIAKLKLSVVNYCIRKTHVLERWKTVVNVMILKEPGNYKIHRLRVIHIYEADFNLIMAVKWRQLLHYADKQNTINEGQYGGRPGCEAQSLTLLEELKYDISYLTRRSLFNFDNDATSCYDRIIVPLASLINRKYGLHKKIVSVHAATLQAAQFRLKTTAGVSDIFYSHCPQFPIHGTGQGSGNSPCIWLFISSTLFDTHATQSHGARFVSPDGKHQISLSMVGFVDDSTGSCNDFQPNTQVSLSTLFSRMENDAQLWNNLLYCSGGKLELPKCSFHVLHFEFDSNGRPRPTLEKFDNRIYVRDSETHTKIPIPAKRAFETHKTLGHHKSPYTTSRHLLRDIQAKANHLALLIATSPISRQGAQLAYHTIFIPSVKYTLPQSFYLRSQLEQAQAQSITKIIAKCGYNRNTARAIIYGPKNFAGAGFLPWHLLQGEGQVTQFLKHWRTNTLVSKTLHIAVRWAQWQSGHGAFILDDTTTSLPYLECRWLRSLRDFLGGINAHIRLEQSIVAPPERRHDIYIMQFARECGLFTTQELHVINYCRLHLHVTTVSELFNADGDTIIPHLFDCHREPWFDPKTYITLQKRPTDYHVRYTWQRLCRQWTTADGKLAESIHLGKWTTTGNKQRRRRQTYTTLNSPRCIYHWRYRSYWSYQKSPSHPEIYIPITSTLWEPTELCLPIQAVEHAGGHLVVRKTPLLQTMDKPTSILPRSFTAYLLTLPQWERDLLTGIDFFFEPYEIQHRLLTIDCGKDLFLVSDGSQQDKSITYGWVLGTSDGTKYAEHSGSGYGTPTSHRAEAWGMLSGTLFLYRLHMYVNFDTSTKPITASLFSDNSGLIQRLRQRFLYRHSYPNATLAPDWEIIEQIYLTSSQLAHWVLSHKWVKGHQDETMHDLSTEAKYNIQADALAGSVHIPQHQNQPQWVLPAEKCRLIIGTTPIHGHYIHEVRQSYLVPPLRAYLAQRYQWTASTQATIDWEVIQVAAQNSQISQPQLVKLVHGKLPTRAEQSKAKPHSTATCHYCDADETFQHLLRCDNPISTAFRQDIVSDIEQYLESKHTPAEIQSLFLTSQQLWYQDSPDSTTKVPSFKAYPNVYSTQQHIGWQLLLQGFVSIEWRYAYADTCRKRRLMPSGSPIDFMAGLIRVIWKSQLSFWEAHLQHIHKDQSITLLRQQDKNQEYRVRIRLLHHQQHQCVHAHRHQYFFPDVESFLQTATTSQMKSYLFHYEAAIHQSQKDALSQHSTRAIWTFPGFHRQSTFRTPLQSIPDGRRTHSQQREIPTDTRGDLIPRKHTRWKKVSTTIRGIRDYFLNTSPT